MNKFHVEDRVKFVKLSESGTRAKEREYLGREGEITRVSNIQMEYKYKVKFDDENNINMWNFSDEELELVEEEEKVEEEGTFIVLAEEEDYYFVGTYEEVMNNVRNEFKIGEKFRIAKVEYIKDYKLEINLKETKGK